MSRESIKNKLGRAVRSYRGVARGKRPDGTVIWIQPPRPAERPRVVKLLDELCCPDNEIEIVDMLQTVDEYNQWIKTLR